MRVMYGGNESNTSSSGMKIDRFDNMHDSTKTLIITMQSYFFIIVVGK